MREEKLLWTTVVIVVFLGSELARRSIPPRRQRAEGPGACRRIVALAPSITETLFALGIGDRVVGVSRWSDYPPEAASRPIVGGYFDPNYEAILALRPDLVVVLQEQHRVKRGLEKLGLRTLAVRHQDIDGILASLPLVGHACGAEAKAAVIAADIRARLDYVQSQTTGLSRPRVLLVIQRLHGTGRIQQCTVAGADGFFDRIIEIAGGQNACRLTTARFPTLSAEAMVRMDPEVIIDLSAGVGQAPARSRPALDDWRQLSQVSAVRSGRVHHLVADYALHPGPRFIMLVEHLAQLIHPGIDLP
jgi:iron complex transport system substrate-binding protein